MFQRNEVLGTGPRKNLAFNKKVVPMSRCQWLPRGTCGQTQYEEQELHDLADACGVRWTDRNYDEVCHDVSGVAASGRVETSIRTPTH